MLVACGIILFMKWQAVWVILDTVVLFLYILPIVRFRDLFRAPPWEIVLLIAIPALIHVLSGSRSFGQLSGAWPEIVAVADSFGLSALAFLIVAELEMYTSFRTNRPFAAIFVMLFTMAVAGWAIVVEFLAAILYGQDTTEMVGSNDRIMGFFVYAFVIGIVMGIVYAIYVGLRPVKRRMSCGDMKPQQSDEVC